MTATAFAILFFATLLFTTALRAWLAVRQMRHVGAHRNAVPTEFAARIDLADHRKAADYTMAKIRLALAELLAGTLLLLALTSGGMLQWQNDAWQTWFPEGGYHHGLALFAGVALTEFAVDLPFALYRNFVIEARFGFNRMTARLFAADLARQALLAVLIGGPLLLVVLWLMAAMGEGWWLHVWLFWLAFNLLVLVLYPTVIAPLFNKFTPLTDAPLKDRIETLLARCGFRTSGLFVMDGSKRSAHGNAYFTGLGAAKRVVFFDTLLEKLAPSEVEAVLAHELGHFKRRHLWKRFAVVAPASLGLLWLLGQLLVAPWFYQGLGVSGQSSAMALILFSLVLPVFTFPLAPVMSWLSRLHEYEADAYAAGHTSASELISALVKLYRDNAATLTPDPLHSMFYDSHPPAALRVARLRATPRP